MKYLSTYFENSKNIREELCLLFKPSTERKKRNLRGTWIWCCAGFFLCLHFCMTKSGSLPEHTPQAWQWFLWRSWLLQLPRQIHFTFTACVFHYSSGSWNWAVRKKCEIFAPAFNCNFLCDLFYKTEEQPPPHYFSEALLHYSGNTNGSFKKRLSGCADSGLVFEKKMDSAVGLTKAGTMTTIAGRHTLIPWLSVFNLHFIIRFSIDSWHINTFLDSSMRANFFLHLVTTAITPV